MVSSPPECRAGSGSKGQLLHELQALTHALYQSRRSGVSAHAPSPASLVKSDVRYFLSKGDAVPARRGSSYDTFMGDGGRSKTYSLPVFANHASRPAFSLGSRHSLIIPQPTFTDKVDNSAAGARFSASAATQQQVGLIDIGEMTDIRSRYDRRPRSWSYQASIPRDDDFCIDENEDFSRKLEMSVQKKRSIWNWKPLRALSHIGRQRFHCVFSAHVRAIDGLPAAMNGLRLAVHLRKRDTKEGAVQTLPSRILQGIAEFEEILYIKCSIYGTRSSSRGIKFMSRDFILSVFAPDVDELDFGRHQLDLSRLLAESIDDKRGEFEKHASWNTSFELTGKAKGARVIITFDYEILEKDSHGFLNGSSRFRGSPTHGDMRSSYSVPNSAHGTPRALTARPHSDISPFISEPGDELDRLFAMEHLSLDESRPIEDGSVPLRGMSTEMQGFSSFPPHSEPPPPASHALVNETFGLEPNSTSFPEDDTGSWSLSEPLPDASNGTWPKTNDFPQGDSGFESQSTKFSPHDSSLAPETPIQSLESLNSVGVSPASMKETLVIRQTTEEDEIWEEETQFEVVEQGTEGFELQEIVTFERGDDAAEPDGGQSNLNEVDTFVSANESLGDVLYHIESSENSLVEHHLDLEENDQDRLKESQPSHLQESVHLEIRHPGWEVAAGDLDFDGKKPVTTQVIMLTLDTLLQGAAAAEISPREAIQNPTISECKEVEVSEVVQQEVNSEVAHKTRGDASEVVFHQETESAENRREENLENEVDLVAGEFIHMLETEDNAQPLSSDSEPDSPRAQLLKQFEKEALLEGGLGLLAFPEIPEFTLDGSIDKVSVKVSSGMLIGDGHFIEEHSSLWDSDDDKELTSIMEAADTEFKRATQCIRSKTRAKMLEDAETEALMQEWGLDENTFANSPPKQNQLNPFVRFQDPLPLANGLGAVVPVKDGGSLRSTSLTHFQSSKNGGKLVMQVSKPVVVPAEMGSGAVDVLRNMAATGLENMAVQAMAVMPLEDVTGQTLQQIAMEGLAAEKASAKGYASQSPGNHSRGLSSVKKAVAIRFNESSPGAPTTRTASDEFVSLEDLCPMAMQQIEALTFEGLKIQSDMTEEDAPYALNAISFVDTRVTESKDAEKQSGFGMLKSVAGVPLLHGGKTVDGSEISSGSNGLMTMAISLDEWVRLDAGLDCDTKTDKNMLAILEAHHAVKKDIVGCEHDKSCGRENKSSKGSRWGFMGNTVTIAMLVQLRDPSHHFEAVGSPMMALVQAERVVVPPKPKLGRTIVLKSDSETEDEAEPLFKITGVHMAGLKSPENDKKNGWGSQKQRQLGSKWLIAHGMTKSATNVTLLKSKPSLAAALTSSGTSHRESLWSISSRFHGGVSKWKEAAKLNSHIRNPDIIFGNQNTKRRIFI